MCSGACALGFADCNSNKLTDGCEINTTTDPTHCSTCATICVGANGTATCTSSVCGIVCAPDYGNCDGNLATGCETNLLIDVNNCGGCSRPCSTTHVTGNTNGLSCNARVCDTTACVTGWSNVNFPPGTLGDDGCETATP